VVLAGTQQKIWWRGRIEIDCWEMPSNLNNLINRTEVTGTPAPPLVLEPWPEELVRAFPAVEAWLKTQNLRLVEYTNKLNQALTAVAVKAETTTLKPL